MKTFDLTRSDLEPFLQKSNWAGARTLLINWGLIVLSLVLVALWPNVLSVLLALIVIGGRQLSLGIMMHDCAHQSLFRSPALNRWVGKWLSAAPILANLDTYWNVHAQHHRLAGTPEDPDLPNYQAYPVSRRSLWRKIFRDLTGQTGIKIFLGSFGRGRDLFTMNEKQDEAAGNEISPYGHLLAPLIFHSIFFGLLWLSGHPWLYLLWVGAYFTTYMLFARIRQIAEHGAVPDLQSTDPLQNTRTTLPRWWERLTVAPNHVNYHLEHHLYASVPPYHLKALHRFLKAKGYFEGVWFPKGYGQVLQHAASAGALKNAPTLPA